MCQLVILLLLLLPTTQGAVPGTFFWKPRLGLHLLQTTKPEMKPRAPTKAEIIKEMVVLINGYQVGLTVMALVAGYYAATRPFVHLNPMHAHYYTNVYRWGLRHLSLLPNWLGGVGNNYVDTHKVWRRRYYYMDEFTPKWMRILLPWVRKEEWAEEEAEYKLYLKYGEPTFGKHYFYPGKKFNNYKSQISEKSA